MRSWKLKGLLAVAALAVPLVVEAQAPPPAPPANPKGVPYRQSWGRPGFGPGMQRRGQMGFGMQRRGWGMQRGMMRGRGWGMGPGAGFGMREGRRGAGLGLMLRDPAIRERIGVTPEQAAKIQSQESAFAQNRIRTRADLQAKQMELRELKAAEKPDRALIDKKMKDISDARLAAEKSQFDHQLTMRGALTPEQQKKLEEWRNEQRQLRQQTRPGAGFRRGPMPPNAPQPPNPPQPPSSPDGN